MANLWHEVDISKELLGIVEMPRGTFLKYEIDMPTGALKLKGFNKAHVPANFGFIPRTLSENGRPLEVFIYSTYAVEPLAIVNLNIERIIHCMDGEVGDSKVIATIAGDNLKWTGVDNRIEAAIQYLRNYKPKLNIIEIMDHKVATQMIAICYHNYLKHYSHKVVPLIKGLKNEFDTKS